MTILAVGSGGREHAIVEGLSRSPTQPTLYCAPGNTGTAAVPACTNIDAHSDSQVLTAAGELQADLVVVGPENPAFDERLFEEFRERILEPTLSGIRAEQLDYRGVLYFGLMVTSSGIRLLEYNVRLGDPEAQAVLPLVQTDLVELFRRTARGELESVQKNSNTLSAAAPAVSVSAGAGKPDS